MSREQPVKAIWNAERIKFGELVPTAEAQHWDAVHGNHAPSDKFDGGACLECGDPWPCDQVTRARDYLHGR